jgi:hypothetical protein
MSSCQHYLSNILQHCALCQDYLSKEHTKFGSGCIYIKNLVTRLILGQDNHTLGGATRHFVGVTPMWRAVHTETWARLRSDVGVMKNKVYHKNIWVLL